MKIAIIGCGYSGLSAIRRCKEFGIDCVAFEINNEVGGLWLYTDRVGVDEFGISIQTSLYESLRTNSPKQSLELPDFPFRTEENTCYPRHVEVKRYLREFAEHFSLLPHIKFRYYVNKISSLKDKWQIEVKNLVNNCQEIHDFDAVMICNGHTTKPYVPDLKGAELFEGLTLHCHDYRKETIFANKNVLIIGFGPSGTEIAHEASFVATKTYVSQRDSARGKFHSIIFKPAVKELRKHEVLFVDGSVEEVDVIVYCTGYLYDFPFLDKSCGIEVKEGRIIQPLYKHFINIERPTMCFIGLFQYVIVSYLFDLQVQAFLKFLTQQIKLPSKSFMLQWWKNETKRKKRLKIPSHRYYQLNAELRGYFEDITAEAKLENIAPVLFEIFDQNERTYAENYYKHRRWYFEIMDRNNYKAYLKEVDD